MDENAWAGLSGLHRAVCVLEEEGTLSYEEFRVRLRVFCRKPSDCRALIRILFLRNLAYKRCKEGDGTEGTSRCAYALTKMGKKMALGAREEVERLLSRKEKIREKREKRLLRQNSKEQKKKNPKVVCFAQRERVLAFANSRLWIRILGEVFAKELLFAEIPVLFFLQKAKELAWQQSESPDRPRFWTGGILAAMIKDRLLEEENERVRLTKKGRLVLRNAFGWGDELCRREKRHEKLRLKARELGVENVACGVRKLKKLVCLAQRDTFSRAM